MVIDRLQLATLRERYKTSLVFLSFNGGADIATVDNAGVDIDHAGVVKHEQRSATQRTLKGLA